MIYLAIWLRLRAFLSSAGAWIARNPLLALCAALAALSAYSWHGWSNERDRFAAYRAAGVEAAKQQAQLRATETKAYQEKANVADANHLEGLDRARTATRAYVDDHRVRPEGGSCPSVALGQADPAGQPAPVPSTAVMVAESDVQRAAEWQAFGVACHDWALSISGDN